MLDELEAETGRQYELTSAISAGGARLPRWIIRRPSSTWTHIFLMSYDFSGAFDLNNLAHQTNLFASSWDPATKYTTRQGRQGAAGSGWRRAR